MGALPLRTGSILLIGAFLYVFLATAPATGLANLYAAVGLDALITVNGFFALGHMVVYGALTLGFCLVIRSVDHRPAIAVSLLSVGIVIEILQETFFSRQFQLSDVAANTAGIALALIVVSILERRAQR
jgi:VanZ family protein